MRRLLFIFCMFLCTTIFTFADESTENNKNTIIQTGWVSIDGHMQWYDENGVPVIGWKIINGETYFFNDQGVMVTGKYSINGNWYFFEENNSGKLVKSGWYQSYDGLWHYVADASVLANSCWKFLHGQYYYFDQDSNMYTGWLLENGKYYYLANDGPMVTGWSQINGN